MSCVLVALTKRDRLVVANCGDCRAVLGSKLLPSKDTSTKGSAAATDKYVCTRLSSDHNAREPSEHEARLELVRELGTVRELGSAFVQLSGSEIGIEKS